jgi:hypothetical protein
MKKNNAPKGAVFGGQVVTPARHPGLVRPAPQVTFLYLSVAVYLWISTSEAVSVSTFHAAANEIIP